jgi:phospholipid transport system transporter-binding protein
VSGVLTLPPELTHVAASDFSLGLNQAVLSQPDGVVVDASALKKFDSSALAVLIECRRQALVAGKAFSVYGMPERLRHLANLYGVEELIPPSADAGAGVSMA